MVLYWRAGFFFRLPSLRVPSRVQYTLAIRIQSGPGFHILIGYLFLFADLSDTPWRGIIRSRKYRPTYIIDLETSLLTVYELCSINNYPFCRLWLAPICTKIFLVAKVFGAQVSRVDTWPPFLVLAPKDTLNPVLCIKTYPYIETILFYYTKIDGVRSLYSYSLFIPIHKILATSVLYWPRVDNALFDCCSVMPLIWYHSLSKSPKFLRWIYGIVVIPLYLSRPLLVVLSSITYSFFQTIVILLLLLVAHKNDIAREIMSLCVRGARGYIEPSFVLIFSLNSSRPLTTIISADSWCHISRPLNSPALAYYRGGYPHNVDLDLVP